MSEIEKIKKMAKEQWDKGNYAVAESLMDEAHRQEAAQQSVHPTVATVATPEVESTTRNSG